MTGIYNRLVPVQVLNNNRELEFDAAAFVTPIDRTEAIELGINLEGIIFQFSFIYNTTTCTISSDMRIAYNNHTYSVDNVDISWGTNRVNVIGRRRRS